MKASNELLLIFKGKFVVNQEYNKKNYSVGVTTYNYINYTTII